MILGKIAPEMQHHVLSKAYDDHFPERQNKSGKLAFLTIKK
jgi:hypothetical protein